MTDLVNEIRERLAGGYIQGANDGKIFGTSTGDDVVSLLKEIERLRAAISDNLPGLSAIDDGTWHEYTGDLVLKEEQWNAIVAATREVRVGLAGGEAARPTATGEPNVTPWRKPV